MRILKKIVYYHKYNEYGSSMTKEIFLYDKEGKRLTTKIFHSEKLDQSAKYFYNDAKQLAEVQITYHRLNKKDLIFYSYDKDGVLKESKVCFETPENLLFRIEYVFDTENDKSTKAKCFDSHNNLLKESQLNIPLTRIYIHAEPYLGSELEYYELRVKYDSEYWKMYPVKRCRNRNNIKIDFFSAYNSEGKKRTKTATVKIITDKDNNTEKLHLKSDSKFELIKKYYW